MQVINVNLLQHLYGIYTANFHFLSLWLEKYLVMLKINSISYSSDLRIICHDTEGLDCSKTLKAFREGKTQVLVSSDAMTRGMDVEAVQNVINYDKPAHIKTYIHRAGRTARAGQSGRCFTMVHKDEVWFLFD